MSRKESGLKTLYQQIIHKTRYARFLPDKGRRETWDESVDRYLDFFQKRHPDVMTESLREELFNAIYSCEVMPSMRALWSAGPALEESNIAGYNCAYVAIDHPRSFDEILYVLMHGTGVGFSVEKDSVSELPVVQPLRESDGEEVVIVFGDSKLGWARGFRRYLSCLWDGGNPTYDLSKLRPKGAILKTFGGRSSGPEPLQSLLDFCTETFAGARGRKLTTLECHDIVCKIADIVVCGGVRRSALISISNIEDNDLRDCKTNLWSTNELGQPICKEPQRQLANNSAVYSEKPSIPVFLAEWEALMGSGSGERGIFNREAARIKCGLTGRNQRPSYGPNPCAEILLQSGQFCNLSEVIVRPGDSVQDLERKVRLATILGTFQASLTKFPHLRLKWTKQTVEEALLGVSLTGIMDHPMLNNINVDLEQVLTGLREVAWSVNKEYAGLIGINPSASVTCVKPSGSVSQLVDSSSGIHARYSPYYLRRIRNSRDDPTSQALIAAGVPYEPDSRDPNNTLVFSFPMKAPEGAKCSDDFTATQQLEHWLLFKKHWCTHTASVTITVREDEWLRVGSWVYDHFDDITGLSFLPYFSGKDESGTPYPQMPYEPIDKEAYEELARKMPSEVDWSSMSESEDKTEGAKTVACSSGQCEI